ncbi:MAG: ORF6N domain-containing protein [Chloroflexi bacterium]|nr:MAG: ORF6N domain-containing protein [Chloroflexota bacterium]
MDVVDQIREVRGLRVLLDFDLAALYGVTTKRLNEAVRRNPARFPPDFAFRLTPEEVANLRSQFATSRWGGTRYAPRAFTEQGVAMLSGVLNSPTAVAVNVEIMRAFVTLRRVHGEHAELARRIDELEARYDESFKVVFDAIRALMEPPAKKARPIGLGRRTERR